MFQQLPNRAGTVTPEQQKSHCTRGTDAMAQQKSTVSILRHAARVVAYVLALVVASAAMAFCQDWQRAHALNCNAPGVVCDI